MKALLRSLKAALGAVINSSLLVWNNDADGILWAPALGLIVVSIFITSLNNGMKCVIIMFAHKTKGARNILVERLKIQNVLDKLEKRGITVWVSGRTYAHLKS